MIVNIITDNEWIGKYGLIELQFLRDNFQIISLGDNLPTGPIDYAGSPTFFKIHFPDILKENPGAAKLPLSAKLFMVYENDPEGFKEYYEKAAQYIKDGAEFLKKSRLPVIKSIMGNREYDYQAVLDLLSEHAGLNFTSYVHELNMTRKFEMYDKPMVLQYDSSAVLFLPYAPKGAKEYLLSLDDSLDEIRDMNPERTVILTHENPNPQLFSSKRAPSMGETLDAYILGAEKIGKPTILFCGHLDISAEPEKYKNVIIQPLSGTEFISYDFNSGLYSRRPLLEQKNDN